MLLLSFLGGFGVLFFFFSFWASFNLDELSSLLQLAAPELASAHTGIRGGRGVRKGQDCLFL